MNEQLKRAGWVYILHENDDLGLAMEIKLGLNRLGHPIWVQERDAPDLTDLKAHHIGAERAAFVVVLETAFLRSSSFAHELVEWAEEVPMLPPKFITVKVECGDSIAWTGPNIHMQRSPRQLVHAIDRAMQEAQKRRVMPARAPEGRRGRYALLSYASSDADKAADVRQNLAELGVEIWDYAVCPRDATIHYDKEIKASIEKAKTVLIILTAAWLKSKYCRSEFDHARESKRRRVWLRFGPGKPLEDCESRNLVDFRGPSGKVKGFDQLATVLSQELKKLKGSE